MRGCDVSISLWHIVKTLSSDTGKGCHQRLEWCEWSKHSWFLPASTTNPGEYHQSNGTGRTAKGVVGVLALSPFHSPAPCIALHL